MMVATFERSRHAKVAIGLLASVSLSSAVSVTELFTVDIPSVAVTSFVPSGLGPDPAGPSLLVTTFSPTAPADHIFLLTGLEAAAAAAAARGAQGGAALTASALVNVTVVDDDATWPNQADVSPLPPSPSSSSAPSARGGAGVLAAGGFFVSVPGGVSKSMGSVDLYQWGGDQWDEGQRQAKVSASRNTTITRPRGGGGGGGESGAFQKTQLSTDKAGFFYHHAAWVDGGLHVLAARCRVPPPYALGQRPQAELVLLTQRAEAQADAGSLCRWSERVVVANGPDVGFALVDLDGDGVPEVASAEFFAHQRVGLYRCPPNPRGWAGCQAPGEDKEEAGGVALLNVSSAVLDDSEGAMFNVQAVDLDGDGTPELLVTSQGDHGRGKVLAYALRKQQQPATTKEEADARQASSSSSSFSPPASPSFMEAAAWTKYVLADGYAPTLPLLPGRGAPGAAIAFDPYPQPASASGGVKQQQQQRRRRPWIVVSADDGGWVDILVPSPSSSAAQAKEEGSADEEGEQEGVFPPWAFTYTRTRVVQSSGTIGTPSVGDVDGDGTPELFVPLYAEGRLATYALC